MDSPVALYTALHPPKSSLVSQGLLVERMRKVSDVSLAYASLCSFRIPYVINFN